MNKSGTITPAELQKALVNGNGTEFNMVTIDSMISKISSERHHKMFQQIHESYNF